MIARVALFTFAGVCIVAIGYYMAPWLWMRARRRRLCRRGRRSQYLFITLYDGPGSRLTQAVLDLLRERGAKASFFVLGRNIAGNEAILRRMADEGHEICSHGFDHRHDWKTWPWQGIANVKRGWNAIDRALGATRGVYPYRPPYGKLNAVTWLYLLCKRAPIVYWTVDSGDTWRWDGAPPSPGEVARRLSGGGVLLAHDFDRAAVERENYVLSIIDSVTAMAREKGLALRTVSELRSLS